MGLFSIFKKKPKQDKVPVKEDIILNHNNMAKQKQEDEEVSKDEATK